jgi:hypothetical protein
VVRRQGGEVADTIDEQEIIVANPKIQARLDAKQAAPLSGIERALAEQIKAQQQITPEVMKAYGFDTAGERKLKEKYSTDVENLLQQQALATKDLSSDYFRKKRERLEKPRYPFASIAKGISAGMDEPTIAMMLTKGISTTAEGIEADKKELDTLTRELEAEEFGEKSKEMSKKQQQALKKLQTDTDAQLALLRLPFEARRQVMAMVKDGATLMTAIAKAQKGDIIKVSESTRKSSEKAANDELGISATYETVNGELVLTKVTGKEGPVTPEQSRQVQQFLIDWNRRFGNAMEYGATKNNEALSQAAATEHAKKMHRERLGRPSGDKGNDQTSSDKTSATSSNPRANVAGGGSNVTGIRLISSPTVVSK